MIKTICSNLHCLSLCLVFTLLGCNTHYAVEDSALAPFNNMYEIDRDRYGLGPLPKKAKVFIDRADSSTSGYDVMLRIYSKSNHYVAFRREGDRYKWVGELEQCEGPREYRSADGRMNEGVTISYFQHASGYRDGLHTSYVGPDSLTDQEIPLEQAKQLARQWGCS